MRNKCICYVYSSAALLCMKVISVYHHFKKTKFIGIFFFFFFNTFWWLFFWIHAFDFRQLDEDSKPDTSHAIGWALATFLRHNSMVDKKHSSMERVQSFVAKDKKKILMQRKRVGMLRLHQLIQKLHVRYFWNLDRRSLHLFKL